MAPQEECKWKGETRSRIYNWSHASSWSLSLLSEQQMVPMMPCLASVHHLPISRPSRDPRPIQVSPDSEPRGNIGTWEVGRDDSMSMHASVHSLLARSGIAAPKPAIAIEGLLELTVIRILRIRRDQRERPMARSLEEEDGVLHLR